MPTPSAIAPAKVNLTTALIGIINLGAGENSVHKTVALTGTINGVNDTFDIPDSELFDTAANNFVALSDGSPDVGATFSEGTGTGGADQIVFSVPPTTTAEATVFIGVRVNFGPPTPAVQVNTATAAELPGGLDAPEELPTSKRWQYGFPMNVMNVGAGRIPPLVLLLQGSGMDFTANAPDDYSVTSADEVTKGLAMEVWNGLDRRTVLEALADYTITFPSGDLATADFTIQGNYEAPVEEGPPTGLSKTAVQPPLVELLDFTIGYNGVTVTMNQGAPIGTGDTVLTVVSTTGVSAGDLAMPAGTNEIVKVVSVDSGTQLTVTRAARGSFAEAFADGTVLNFLQKVCGITATITCGNEINDRLCFNSAEGISGRDITSRATTIEVTMEQVPQSVLDMWDKLDTGVRGPVGFLIGSGTAERVAFFFPSCRVTNVADGTQDNFWTYTVSMSAKPSTNVPTMTARFF